MKIMLLSTSQAEAPSEYNSRPQKNSGCCSTGTYSCSSGAERRAQRARRSMITRERQDRPGPGPSRPDQALPGRWLRLHRNAAERQAPHQHGQVHMDHQRRVEKTDPGDDLRHIGGARHHQQHREHTRAQQRQNAQATATPGPAGAWSLPGTLQADNPDLLSL